MSLTRVRLERFTAFTELDLELSPGLNVLLGENGTGKTHVMKVCYAACDVARTGGRFGEKLVGVFMPSDGGLESWSSGGGGTIRDLWKSIAASAGCGRRSQTAPRKRIPSG